MSQSLTELEDTIAGLRDELAAAQAPHNARIVELEVELERVSADFDARRSELVAALDAASAEAAELGDELTAKGQALASAERVSGSRVFIFVNMRVCVLARVGLHLC